VSIYEATTALTVAVTEKPEGVTFAVAEALPSWLPVALGPSKITIANVSLPRGAWTVIVQVRLPAEPVQLGEPAEMSAIVAGSAPLAVIETDFAEGEMKRGFARDPVVDPGKIEPVGPTTSFKVPAERCTGFGGAPNPPPPPHAERNATISRA